MADKKALYQAAQDAGHELPDYDDITGKELEALLAGGGDSGEDKSGSADGLTVTNLRKNPVSVQGVEIEPNGSITLTPAQLEDERLMAKIEHGVKTGVYAFGK